MKNYKEKLKDITTFIFDYDGVMTTGEVLVDGNGIPLRSSDVKDGYALQLAVRLGYNVAVITGGYSVSIEKRMAMLGVKDVFVRSANKVEVLERYMKTNDIKPEQIVYIGILRYTGAIIAKVPSPFLSCATLVGKRNHLSSPWLGWRVGEIYTHSFATHRNECACST